MLAYITATNDDDAREQIDHCMELMCERLSIKNDSDYNQDVANRLKRKNTVTVVFDETSLQIISGRQDLNRDVEMTLGERFEHAFEQGAREIIVTAGKSLTNPDAVKKYLNHVRRITFARKRISFERGTSDEQIHRVMSVVKETKTTRDGHEILREEWTGGRPPIGTEVVRGQLVKGDDYHSIRNILQRVAFGDITKSKATREIGCARKTIGNSLRDRAELYDLPQQ